MKARLGDREVTFPGPRLQLLRQSRISTNDIRASDFIGLRDRYECGHNARVRVLTCVCVCVCVCVLAEGDMVICASRIVCFCALVGGLVGGLVG